MKIFLETSGLKKGKVSKDFIQKVVEKTVALAGKLKVKKSAFGVAFVGPSEIRHLNHEYRKKNKITDVLSFGFSDSDDPAGEVVLCSDIIEKDARKNKVPYRKQLAFVLSHGILHILGLKHGKEMYDLQDKLINKITK